MPAIDDKFVDVDFEKQPEYVRGDLGVREFAKQHYARYADVETLIPESKWEEESDKLEAEGGGLEKLVTRVFNQSNEGSCVGNAGTQGHQVVQAKQFGKENVTQLSAVSLYQQIGRSPGSGAMVDDALEMSRDVGILPLDTPENRAKYGDACMAHTGFYNKKPANWKDTAKRFRIREFLVIRSIEELVTAGLKQHPVIVGRAGHSILYLRPVIKNGKLTYIYVNSWGNWGFGAGDFESGFGADSRSMISSSAQWAYAVRSVVDWRVAA